MKQATRVGLSGMVVGSCVLGAALVGAGGCSFSNTAPGGAPDAHFGAEGGGFEAGVPDGSGTGDDGGGKGGDGGTASDGGGHEGGGEGSATDGGCGGAGGPGTWTCIGSLGTARIAPGVAALPGGKALVAGGWNATSKVLTSAEIYDPVTQGFTPTGSMKGPHLWAGWGLTWPVLAGGKVLAAGGLDSNGALVGAAELYDPAAGTFTATGSLVTPVISMFPLVLKDGSALLVGGWSSTTATPPTPGWQFTGDGTSEVQRFSPAAGTWADTGALAEHRLEGCEVVLANGHVLAIGGANGATSTEANVEDFDPSAGTWTSVHTLATPSTCTQAFAMPDGTVLLVGDGTSAGADLLDPATFTTTPTTGFLADWQPIVTQLASGDVIALGGSLSGALTTKTMVLHAGSAAWTATGDLREPRSNGGVATALTTGEVLVVGGGDASDAALATAELYHP